MQDARRPSCSGRGVKGLAKMTSAAAPLHVPSTSETLTVTGSMAYSAKAIGLRRTYGHQWRPINRRPNGMPTCGGLEEEELGCSEWRRKSSRLICASST
jgi:hypothetical protein